MFGFWIKEIENNYSCDSLLEQKSLDAYATHTMEGIATVRWDTSHAVKSLSVLHTHKDGLSCCISANPTERLRINSAYTPNSHMLRSSLALLPRDKIG